MAIDQSKLVMVATQLMEQLEGEHGDEASISTAMIVVAVDAGPEGNGLVHFRASPDTPAHVGVGLLTLALDRMRRPEL
jgi:hypothetical protein